MNKNKVNFFLAMALLCLLSLGCQNNNSSELNKQESTQQEVKVESNTVQEDKNVQEVKKEENSKKDFSYFDDVVFVGDSVTLKLKLYVLNKRKTEPNFMGKSQYLSAGSLGYSNSLWKVSDKSVHPTYNGEKMLLEDSVKACGAKKIYIMLGINDIALYGISDTLSNAKTLLEKIKENSPGIQVFVQSVTPIFKTYGGLSNEKVMEFDNKLAELCKENNYKFLDLFSVLKNENNALPKEYCSDPEDKGIHFTDIACEKWIDFLLNN